MATITKYTTNVFAGTGSGATWSNLGYMKDGGTSVLYTTATHTGAQASNLLYCKGFNLGVPSGATIDGIAVTFGSSTGVGTLNRLTFTNIQLLKPDSTLSPTDKANSTDLDVPVGEKTFGSSTELWGVALTPTMVNDDDFGIMIKVTSTNSVTSALWGLRITVYYTLNASTVDLKKTYAYKVYSPGGVYITDWTDVSSDVAFTSEINSAGSQMTVELARNAGDYGEGSDVDFAYQVRVYCYDRDEPLGSVVFRGFISAYTPIYKDNKIVVTLLSFGEELDRFMLQNYVTLDANGETYWGAGENLYQGAPTAGAYTETKTFTVASGCTSIQKIELGYYDYSTGGYEVTFSLKRGATVIGTAIKNGAILAAPLAADFVTPVAVTAGESLTLSWTYESTTPTNWYRGVELSAGVLKYRVYIPDGTTLVTYSSQDPSDMLKDIINKYREAGGTLNYDADSIDDTGTTVSYNFNANTTLEAVKKCLELAPKGWYWYVDSATNLVHFHAESQSANHMFSLEKDLADAKFEKRIEDMKNTIYFTGGGDPALYLKFVDAGSIASYGIKAMKYIDQRVTSSATAETIANSILEAKSQPELRVTLEVLDSNTNNGIGYDLESIEVGDVVAVRNVSQQVGLFSWDAGKWDEAYWDFNIYNLSSFNMQVQRISYTEDVATLYASTLALDVNKRIEDINRNLETQQTINNPDIPS